MKYTELIQLYFERTTALKATATQHHAALAAIEQSDAGSTAAEIKPVRDLLKPALNPASLGSTQTTHLISDVLTIIGLWVMELRRRKNVVLAAVAAQPFP